MILMRPYTRAPHTRNHIGFVNVKDLGRVNWKSDGTCKNVKIDISQTLSKILGFVKTHVFTRNSLLAADPSNLQFSLSTLWVYSNVVEPNIVGDTHANLLRIVPVENGGNGKRGKTIVKSYERPHYHNVAMHTISMLEIEIDTTYGLTPILFKDHVVVKLHFRKKKLISLQ